MTRIFASLAVLATVGLALPQATSAQPRPNDRQYCEALVDKYRAYVSDPNRGHNGRAPNVEFEVAISKCRAGDTTAGIPPLEKALRDARVNLPARG